MSKMEDILQKFSSNTTELLKYLDNMEKSDLTKLNKKDRDILISELERIEEVTGKADSLSAKTKREGVPEMQKDLQNKLENEFKPKPAETPKPKRSNLMKPKLSNSLDINNSKKEKEKK